jgi:hypothetical protein
VFIKNSNGVGKEKKLYAKKWYKECKIVQEPMPSMGLSTSLYIGHITEKGGSVQDSDLDPDTYRRPSHLRVHRLTLPLNHNLSKLRLRRKISSCLVDSDFVNPSAT